MVTIRDVARAAGVSTSTVSRALDERLPRSRSATAERVRDVARELGYVRDPLASGLRRAGTSTIGVIVPRLTDTVMAMLYEEIAAASAERGVFAVVASTEDSPEAERRAADSLMRRRVDGLILTTARLDTAADEREERPSPPPADRPSGAAPATGRPAVPRVLALRTDGLHPASVGDDLLGARLATRHLLDLGHRRIGLVGGPEHASSALLRHQGHREALREMGVEPDPLLMTGDSFSMEAGEAAGRRLLALPDPPTAIFAVNDNTAIGVLAAAHQRGLRVPEDLSVVGYNDIPTVSRLPVPLSTVRVPFDQVARGALRLLLEEREPGSPPPVLTATPTFIPRGSSRPPRSRS
ncbi:LacI family DNA-binding transcriptional regulator [Streptomyces spiramenti]|uniref:Substrate-binding domain-containing protein n=1 Tax=Streptomyces spiramenti TaxID=2720606 RepID=A0ABX1AST5_9ACTN|nr:LacI family DNA-binding transcriptional regulator [Streptomyces spiramenti]NJP69211.1 substrate-binding domain-containing protein [Streptomyces spiramenti]